MSNSPRIASPGQMHEGVAWMVRRLGAVWVAAWMGMILLVVTLTVVTLSSTELLRSAPPDGYAQAAKLAGEPLIHELLRYEAAEISGEMLGVWGWIQLGLSTLLATPARDNVEDSSSRLHAATAKLPGGGPLRP